MRPTQRSSMAASSSKYRQYTKEDIKNAYFSVKNKSMSVRQASISYKVPRQTLRDRLSGRIDIETCAAGQHPIFSEEEESSLVDHIKSITKSGYCYSKQEIINMALEYASSLGKTDADNKTLTFKWYGYFVRRWPDLRKLLSVSKTHKAEIDSEQLNSKAETSEMQVVESTTDNAVETPPPDTVSNYFMNLREILIKYNLTNKPHCIFNIYGKEISRNIFPRTPGQIEHPYASSSSYWMTILGGGSAAGMAIPPYLIFPGKRKHPYMMKGATPGTSCTISETGLCNAQVLRQYLEEHFLDFVPGRRDQPILLIISGHMMDSSLLQLNWAKSHNIIMMILPAHCSHFLQPLEVECYWPLLKNFESEFHKMLRNSPLAVLQDNICQIACTSYNKAMCPERLQLGFNKAGIFPYNPAAINKHFLLSSEIAVLNQLVVEPLGKNTEITEEEEEEEEEIENNIDEDESLENGNAEDIEYIQENQENCDNESASHVTVTEGVCVDNIRYVIVERNEQLIL